MFFDKEEFLMSVAFLSGILTLAISLVLKNGLLGILGFALLYLFAEIYNRNWF